ncbi:hypothetical protein [Engelhardtia mirabilis]|uniref:ATP synthase I chain n=1 Tax=Engelhardtia mirabilis TaxID=2528011 RepID=A0A518BK42_9BACT|nr:hypothetical protein Pla133_24260 [Planctomycetes bacterium Pla133]QDV01670.1 hypothetical protein Pla86_24250 [Planctomycetes bacterium Pla86]
MTLTNICLILLSAVAGVVAWILGGREGTGVLLGSLLAAGLTGLGMAYQRQVLATRPNLAVGVLGLFMVVKMFCLLIGAAILRYVPFAAERADWRAFVVAFAPVAVLALIVGAGDTMRRLKAQSRTGTGATEAGAAGSSAPRSNDALATNDSIQSAVRASLEA